MYICSLTSAIGRERLCVNVNLSNSSLIEFDNSKHLDRGSLTSGEALVVEACEHPVLSSELREYCSAFHAHIILYIYTLTQVHIDINILCVYMHTHSMHTQTCIYMHTHIDVHICTYCVYLCNI